jgi:coniferyl-aldehyde dehydrogenase
MQPPTIPLLPFTTKQENAGNGLLLAFETQRLAFLQSPTGYPQRMRALKILRDSLRQHQEDLVQAISEDFGGRSREETLTLEVFAIYSQINHARRHLKSWMRRQPVSGAWFLQPSRAFYQYQPLGVVGVIGTWNYPLLLSIGPMIEALAAGNRVMLKPSEIAGRTAQRIAEIIAKTFPPDYVTCILGGPEVSQAFSALPFDHLFFTGSAQVGQQVLKAAAANLTPVTLELGGKSPVIVHESYPLRRAVERILVGKLYNAGQTCVAPDYVMVQAGQEQAFEELARRQVAALYPTIVDSPDYTRIVSSRHYDRLSALVADAARKGARVVSMGAGGARAFPPTLIFEATDEMAVMREEIFGPVLPVVTYRNIDEAIAFVNARPRPLALYYFDENRRRVDDLLQRTMSGGVTVNDCIFHLGQPNLPFGGVGPSGMGQYHGFDGFVTFSKKRGVMVQRRWAATALLHAPFGNLARVLIEIMLKIESR